ncbi:MAG TPA: POTRA domain-containing protein [Vicinamibacterales bacterium]|nr:POTRA domain-containing protein [Vicinamibacterales bacterium]
MRRVVRLVTVIAIVLAVATVCEANVEQYLGRTITDVAVEVAGVPIADSGVLDLVETHVGEALGMKDVRATVDHLIGLSRFEDVRVIASETSQGVALKWQLKPVRRITKITVDGKAVLPASAIRAELNERFGALPSANRAGEMVTRLQSFYADRGFPRASILPRIQDDDPLPERSELVLTIDAGERLAIGTATITGSPLEPPAEVQRVLGLLPGRPFDQVAFDARVASFEESMRERGYYQTRVRESHVPGADGLTVNVTLSVERGPHVSLVFAGDPMPAGNSEALVPIRAERSVDQDLLEDASLNIENALREQGYRTARAPYHRDERGGELVLTFTVASGPLHRVESVETDGNVRIPHADLAPLLQIKTGDPFVDARVGLVAAAMTELYRVRGFSQATVAPKLQVLPEAESAGVKYRPVAIRFEITEGPQTIVKSAEFTGPSDSLEKTLRAQIGLDGGKPFYRPQLSVDRDVIERAYRNRGFQGVSVTSQLSFENDQQLVAITWAIREGDQVTVDRVLINGNSRISTALIRRELTVLPGAPMSDEAMLESQRNLAALGLFRRVRIIELPRTGSLTRDVLVDVEESATTTIDYGGGLEVSGIGARDADGNGAVDRVDIGPRGFFSISRRNLWGKNRSVTLFGRVTVRRAADDPDSVSTGDYGFNDYRGLFTFREPRAFGTIGDAQLTTFVEQSRRTSFTFNRKGVTSDYARRIGAFTFTGRYTFDYTRIFDDQIAAGDQLLIDRLFPQVKLSKFFGGVLRDSRDDVLDPQRGAVVGLDTSVAAKIYGSEVGFIKSFGQGFIYRRLPGRRVVIAAGARVGLAVGFPQAVPPPLEIARLRQGSGAAGRFRQPDALQVVASGLTRAVDRAELFPTEIKELPASERFFAGGDTTVRGFALDRLGAPDTLDEDGFPNGGNGMAIFNLETRAPYWKNLQFVWFLDAGNVFKRATDIRFTEMRFSSGLGFRYRSPIGPIRVDWGWKLNTQLLLTGGRERSNVLHISLGQAF